MSANSSPDLRAQFAQVVVDALPGMLKHQQPDGSIVYDAKMPLAYPQQSIFPLAFCYAGLDPKQKYKGDAKVKAAIEKLGSFLVKRFDEQGQFAYDSHGTPVSGVEQRLTYAWTEALRILGEAHTGIDTAPWQKKILAACATLRGERLNRLVGLRRFIGRVMGTSTNHVALYLTTVYRAGMVLRNEELRSFALPIARALAEDVHPDGYWEEHGDLLRSGGPTCSYNFLTHCGMALMYEWTGEPVFRAAVERSTHFHGNFSYPDGSNFDLIDERVRYQPVPRVWGLFGFSHSPMGRGLAAKLFHGYSASLRNPEDVAPEMLARMCENYLYWHAGETLPPPFERHEHRAVLTLPAAIFRRGDWCAGLSCMRATNAEDPAYRESPYGLDRQKLFSIWHARAGLLLDGSHSKSQPENSTFAAQASYAHDFWPCGGSVGEEDDAWYARAAYKTFFGAVCLRVLSDNTIQIDLSVDPAGNQGPFQAGFTLRPRHEVLGGLSGKSQVLGDEPFQLTGKELGGGFRHGTVLVKGPEDMKVTWPMSPYNSYAADHKSPPEASLLRTGVELTPERRRASFILTVDP